MEKTTADLGSFVHMALVVPDAKLAAETWAELFGLPVPEVVVQVEGDYPIEDTVHYLRYRGEPWVTNFKIAKLDTPHFMIELIQPGDFGSFREYYEKHGTGLHHMAFVLGKKRDAMIEKLTKGMGFGLRVEGLHSKGDWTVVDTEDVLGTNLNIKR